MDCDLFPAMCNMNSEAIARDHRLVDGQRVRIVLLHPCPNDMRGLPLLQRIGTLSRRMTLKLSLRLLASLAL